MVSLNEVQGGQPSTAKKSAAIIPIAQNVTELQVLELWEKTQWKTFSTSLMGSCQSWDRGSVEPLLILKVALPHLLTNNQSISCCTSCSCAKWHSSFGYTCTPHHKNKWENLCAVTISTCALLFFFNMHHRHHTIIWLMYQFLDLSHNTNPQSTWDAQIICNAGRPFSSPVLRLVKPSKYLPGYDGKGQVSFLFSAKNVPSSEYNHSRTLPPAHETVNKKQHRIMHYFLLIIWQQGKLDNL